MVRPVETIRREIDSLNEATVALAAEFSRLYAGYLTVWGRAAAAGGDGGVSPLHPGLP